MNFVVVVVSHTVILPCLQYLSFLSVVVALHTITYCTIFSLNVLAHIFVSSSRRRRRWWWWCFIPWCIHYISNHFMILCFSSSCSGHEKLIELLSTVQLFTTIVITWHSHGLIILTYFKSTRIIMTSNSFRIEFISFLTWILPWHIEQSIPAH